MGASGSSWVGQRAGNSGRTPPASQCTPSSVGWGIPSETCVVRRVRGWGVQRVHGGGCWSDRAPASPAQSLMGGGLGGGRRGPLRLKLQRLEVGAEFVGQVGAGQRELDGGLEKAELVARVVALALELHPVHRPALPQTAQPAR